MGQTAKEKRIRAAAKRRGWTVKAEERGGRRGLRITAPNIPNATAWHSIEPDRTFAEPTG